MDPNYGWVYGDLLHIHDLFPIIQSYEGTVLLHGQECKRFSDNKVHPETVGQFTGLRDKNGTEIYEDDIVDCDYIVYDPWDDGKETLDPMRCVVEYDDFGFVFKKEEDLYYFLHDVKNIKVIGNIHDDPGLLEGGAQ